MDNVKSLVLKAPADIATAPLRVEFRALPAPADGEVLLKVRACGVCRTDLHIIEGELPPHRLPLVCGHQVVGEIVDSGERVGVSWLGGTDDTCWFCTHAMENLCDRPTFTGYDRDGGYARYAIARADVCYPLPAELDDAHAAPLLCAGTIGFRTIRVAEVQHGERVGLYGFGASAHLALPVLLSMGCDVYVCTREERHRRLALKLGAIWAGEAFARPPVPLDRALTFAPSGDVVVAALSALRKGGVVAVNAIHLDRMPQFDYDSLLWGERQIRSVANMRRDDARDFLALAARIGLRPDIEIFELEQANEALRQLKEDRLGAAAAVLRP